MVKIGSFLVDINNFFCKFEQEDNFVDYSVKEQLVGLWLEYCMRFQGIKVVDCRICGCYFEDVFVWLWCVFSVFSRLLMFSKGNGQIGYYVIL